MHYPKWYPLWTNPDLAWEEGTGAVSLILFTLRQGQDCIVATRCPASPRIPLEGSFFESLDIHPKVREELILGGSGVPLLVRTKVGIGMIDRVYGAEMGLYVYVHVHGRPRRLTALINGGALGNPDEQGFRVGPDVRSSPNRASLRCEREYDLLAEAWSEVEARQNGLLRPLEDGTVYRTHLEETVQRIARTAGCHVTVNTRTHWARCYRPRICEALLLLLFSEACRYSRDGAVTVDASTVTERDGDGLSLAITYTVENGKVFEKEWMALERIRQRMQTVAHSNGMELSSVTEMIPRSHGRATVRLIVDCLYDPAVLETSDLKAPKAALSDLL